MTPQETQLFVDHETIRLTREGIWLSNDQEITHLEQRRAFARHLGHDNDGWFIQIGENFKRIEVEDTAYFVEGLKGSPAAGYGLHLSGDSHEKLDPSTLKYRPGRLTCRIHGGALEAKFLTTSYFELLSYLEEDQDFYFLKIQGKRIVLARKDSEPA